jgi:cobalt/nickel transport protein
MKRKEILLGLLIALGLAGIISLFASSFPDGLERVAADKGFLHKGEIAPAVKAPLADYGVPKIPSQKLSTACAGIFGTLLAFSLAYLLAGRLKSKGN